MSQTDESQIEELQSRITAAMARISAGMDGLREISARVEPDPETEAALDEEKQANAQLEERLRALKDRHAAELSNLREGIEAQSTEMARLDMDLQRLRMANDQLRDSNAALREANSEGVGDPKLINRAMLAEMEALRAARAADAAEASTVLSRLAPLLTAASIEAGDIPGNDTDAPAPEADLDGEPS